MLYIISTLLAVFLCTERHRWSENSCRVSSCVVCCCNCWCDFLRAPTNTHTASDAKSSGAVLGRTALLTLTGIQFYTSIRRDRGTKLHRKRTWKEVYGNSERIVRSMFQVKFLTYRDECLLGDVIWVIGPDLNEVSRCLLHAFDSSHAFFHCTASFSQFTYYMDWVRVCRMAAAHPPVCSALCCP